MMLRLASLRQLELENFDAFDTLCYLIEVLRRCITTDVHDALSVMNDTVKNFNTAILACSVLLQELFKKLVEKTQAAQVQLAFSMSKHGRSLPKTVS
jgi:hypothetical protein